MVIVVGPGLAVVEVRRWNPLGLTVGELHCPPAFINQFMVRLTGQRQPVDVRLAAAGPVVVVMNFGPVSGYIAAWGGAAAILRVEDQSLVRRGYSTGPAQIQRPVFVLVEYRQVVVRVAGHPDDIFHRQQRPAARHRPTSAPRCTAKALELERGLRSQPTPIAL